MTEAHTGETRYGTGDDLPGMKNWRAGKLIGVGHAAGRKAAQVTDKSFQSGDLELQLLSGEEVRGAVEADHGNGRFRESARSLARKGVEPFRAIDHAT